MVTFRDTQEDAGRLRRRIRSILGDRHAMPIGELCMRLGLDRPSVRAELEAMIACGDVERLRPVGCAGEELDYLRVLRSCERPAASPDRWARQA